MRWARGQRVLGRIVSDEAVLGCHQIATGGPSTAERCDVRSPVRCELMREEVDLMGHEVENTQWRARPTTYGRWRSWR